MREHIFSPPELDCYPGFGPTARGSVRRCLDDEARRSAKGKAWATTSGCGPFRLFLFFPCFLAAALARQCFLHPLLFPGLQVKGVTFYFLDDVLLLHLPLEATQGIFQRFAFLQSDFSQRNYTPKPVLRGLVSYCKKAS